MTSFFIVNISFVFSILFFVQGASAGELCGNSVCAPGQTCGVNANGTYQCINPIVFGAPSGSVNSNSGSQSTSSGKSGQTRGAGPKSSPKKPPKIKAPSNSTSAPTDSGDDLNLSYDIGDDANASGGGICEDEQLSKCRPGFHCQNHLCVKDADSDSPPSEINACMQQYEGLMQKCRNQIQETGSTCDEKNDSGMNDIMNGASQLTLSLGQSTASSVQKSCSDTAALMQGANAALAAYRMSCSSAMTDCNSACSAAKKFAVDNNSCMRHLSSDNESDLTIRADDGIKQCNSFDAKVNEANQAIQNFAQTLGNAANCQQATLGDTNLGGGVQKLCASQPNYPGCNPAAPVDCSNPDLAKSNKVCICSKNSMDPACSGSQKMAGDNGLGPNIDPGSRLNNKSGPDVFGGDLQDLPLPEHGNVNASAGKAIDGHQGGNAALGGGDSGAGGGPSGSGGSSTGGTGDQASGSGFYGSGGGIGNYGSGGGYHDGGSGGGRNANGAVFPGKNNNPDLRKFLPGGQFDPRRGLAGMTGPDGITGPHTDIWRKVQNRYQVMQPSLLP